MHRTDTTAARDSIAAGEATLPHIVLEITRGRAQHKSRPVLSSAFLIGTAGDCDLVLGDMRFDPVHSYVFSSPSRVTIRQLGTGPPLRVDGRELSYAMLDDGACVQMGSYEFCVRIDWPEGVLDVRPAGAVHDRDAVPVAIDSLRATERLLQDVELSAQGPQLSLFVGDDQDEADDTPLPLSAIDPRAWRQTPKQASF